MAIVNSAAVTTVDEIADGIYRVSTPAPAIPGGIRSTSTWFEATLPCCFTLDRAVCFLLSVMPWRRWCP